jgi:hypothetical protein
MLLLLRTLSSLQLIIWVQVDVPEDRVHRLSPALLVTAAAPLAKAQPGTSQSPSPSRFRDRHEFAKLLSSIKKGMTGTEVIRILGKPEDIRTPHEMGMYVQGSDELWCYGTDSHLSFPVLGTIFFGNTNGKKIVKGVAGGEGAPPPPSLLSEEELKKLLSVLGESPYAQEGLRWHPAWVIKVVNTLQPVGKRKAIAAMEEFNRVTPLWSDLLSLLILRVLFDVPKDPGYMREFPYPITPPNPKDPRVPRYPILMLGDVPLLVAAGLPFSSGPGTDFGKEIAFFRDHAKIRARPLQPTDKPLTHYSEWKTYAWLNRYPEYLKKYSSPGAIPTNVKWQLRDLVKTVYRGDIEHGSLSRPVRWDMKRNMYTFLDGTTLPESSGKEK